MYFGSWLRTGLMGLMVAGLGVAGLGCSEAATEETQVKAEFDPATMCVVSGEKLGSMGEAYVIQHNGQEIKLCCSSCEPTFRANPEKYLKMLASAPATQPTAQ